MSVLCTRSIALIYLKDPDNNYLSTLFELKFDENASLTDKIIADEAVKFWVMDSIVKYRYPGMNEIVTEYCGNFTQSVDELTRNSFITITSLLTEKVGCQKLETKINSDRFIYLACVYEQLYFWTDCKTLRCVFNDSIYDQFCNPDFWSEVFQGDS